MKKKICGKPDTKYYILESKVSQKSWGAADI